MPEAFFIQIPAYLRNNSKTKENIFQGKIYLPRQIISLTPLQKLFNADELMVILTENIDYNSSYGLIEFLASEDNPFNNLTSPDQLEIFEKIAHNKQIDPFLFPFLQGLDFFYKKPITTRTFQELIDYHNRLVFKR